MDIFVNCILFGFGAIFGSFAGAVAWRIRHKKDFVKGRSECEHCHHQLAVRDLVPIASWLLLRGKCRYCQKAIGASALLSELGLGLAFILSYCAWPYGFETVLSGGLFGVWLVVLVLLAILFLYDARWGELPDKVVFPLIAVATLFFVGKFIVAGDISVGTMMLEALYAVAPIAGTYGLLYYISKGEWVGFGDVKLGIALGLLLGWQGALVALVLANFIGFLFVLPGLVAKKLDKGSHVPFGPFLILASVISMLYGSYLVDAYLQLLLA